MESLLRYTPSSTITFALTPGSQTSTYLTLTNVTDDPVAYKVKTTNVKRYCVRPNTAILEPGEKLDVELSQQSFSSPPQDLEDCRDRFLLQAVKLEASIPTLFGEKNTTTVWEYAPADAILKVRFTVKLELKELREGDVRFAARENPSSSTDPATNLAVASPVITSAPSPIIAKPPLAHATEQRALNIPPAKPPTRAAPLPPPIPALAPRSATLPPPIPALSPRSAALPPIAPPKPITPSPAAPTKAAVSPAPAAPTKAAVSPAPAAPTKAAVSPAPAAPTKAAVSPAPAAPTKSAVSPAPAAPSAPAVASSVVASETEPEPNYKSIAWARERALGVRPAPKVSPPVLDRTARQRVAVEQAGELARVINARQRDIDVIRRELAEARHKLSDAQMATRPAYDVRYEVNESARVPFAQICIMAVISGALLQLLV